MLRNIVRSLVALSLATGAVIEVTAGGSVSEPTYRFSDISGNSVATLKANITDGQITASGDVQTGAGNSIDALHTRLAAAEATIASLQTALEAKLDSATAAAIYQPILGQHIGTDFEITGTTFRSNGVGSLSHAINAMLCLAKFQGLGHTIPSDGLSYGNWASAAPTGCSFQSAGGNKYPHWNTHPSAPSSMAGFTTVTF